MFYSDYLSTLLKQIANIGEGSSEYYSLWDPFSLLVPLVVLKIGCDSLSSASSTPACFSLPKLPVFLI
jgi:hypothetical protein